MAILKTAYCCFAIPLYNFGIYSILAQFAIIGAAVGVLSFVSPKITAISVPVFLPYIFGGACFITAGVQGVGFVGVFKEQARVFQKYTFYNTISVTLTFLLALAVVVISVIRHDTSLAKCETQFLAQQGSANVSTIVSNLSTGETDGRTICNIWMWVQAGIMIGLWITVLASEVYFIFMTRNYSRDQVESHRNYNTVYEAAGEEIALRESMAIDRETRLEGEMEGIPLEPPSPLRSHGRNASRSSGLRNQVTFVEDDETGAGAGPSRRRGHGRYPSDHPLRNSVLVPDEEQDYETGSPTMRPGSIASHTALIKNQYLAPSKGPHSRQNSGEIMGQNSG